MPTKPTILIIDDVLENVEVLSKALSNFCSVQFAESGEEGLELLARSKPELILLDVMMPGMGGYEVFSEIRSNPQTEHIPIIFVTAKNDPASESDALVTGAADFIHKPINVDVARARVKQQLELLQNRRYLEKQVLQRTAELAAARSEAESANAVKTRFMRNVSHEMRTPLQGILGFAEIGLRWAETTGSERAASYFRSIQESGRRMHKLVESLLSIAEQSCTERSQLTADTVQSVRTADFCAELHALMELRARDRQQQFLLEIQASAESFSADAPKIRQVLEHLIANALSYSPQESAVRLVVTDTHLPAKSIEAHRPALSFQVIDSGCGIPESEINAIFEPFYQSTRTDNGAGGTGLGLPLSRCIVSRHGGTLTVTNRPEGGVCAEVILPIEQPNQHSTA